MISGILGTKLGMTQIFKEGKVIPITVIKAGPCNILQLKKIEKEGYLAAQVGFKEKKIKQASKQEIGHTKKAQTTPKKFVRELPWDGKDETELGKEITLAVLEKIRFVDIVGITKGRGFQGGVKRHGFAGGPKTHGQSDRWRAPGASGSSSFPSRVLKGKRMPGHMGNVRKTIKHLEIVDMNPTMGVISVRGSVPGPTGADLLLKKSFRQ